MKMTETGNEEKMAETKGSPAPQVVTSIKPAKMTLAEVRQKLDGKTGRRFWKNLDELAETTEFQELMQEEFPRQSTECAPVPAVGSKATATTGTTARLLQDGP